MIEIRTPHVQYYVIDQRTAIQYPISVIHMYLILFINYLEIRLTINIVVDYDRGLECSRSLTHNTFCTSKAFI